MTSSTDTPNIAPIALSADEGEALWFIGSLTTIKASSHSTAGRVAVIEHHSPRGSGSPLHVHHREDEWFYLIEGQLTLWIGGLIINAPAGSFVYAPRDIPHTYTVASDTARFLVVTQPAGFDNFVRLEAAVVATSALALGDRALNAAVATWALSASGTLRKALVATFAFASSGTVSRALARTEARAASDALRMAEATTSAVAESGTADTAAEATLTCASGAADWTAALAMSILAASESPGTDATAASARSSSSTAG